MWCDVCIALVCFDRKDAQARALDCVLYDWHAKLRWFAHGYLGCNMSCRKVTTEPVVANVV